MKKFAIVAGLALMVGSTGALAHGDKPGYLTSATTNTVVTTLAGECWTTPNSTVSFDTPAECGGEAMAKAEAAPKYMTEESVKTYALYFDFDSTVVGRVSNIVEHIGTLTNLKSVNLVGHADPIGSSAYNMDLSQRRADAVAAKLIDSGVAADKIATSAMGENVPVANCTGTGAQLIACLRPDRRVDVKVTGEKGKIVYE